MKREAKLLLQKATESLVLAIEIFNRPHDEGRIHALKRFRVGGMHHERFSRHAASAIKELLKKEDIATIWEKYKSRDS